MLERFEKLLFKKALQRLLKLAPDMIPQALEMADESIKELESKVEFQPGEQPYLTGLFDYRNKIAMLVITKIDKESKRVEISRVYKHFSFGEILSGLQAGDTSQITKQIENISGKFLNEKTEN